MSSIAQQESDSISKNVRMGIQYHMQQGKPRLNTSNFLGLAKDPETGKLVIIPEEAGLVRRIYREYLEGYSPGMIAAHLTDEEIRAFEAAAAEEAPHRLSEEEEDLFDKLIGNSYVFVDEDWTTINIPAELPALYRAINTPEFDKKRRQLNWIIRCMNDIVPPYYALIPIQKFCRLCRRTGDPQILPEEIPALLRELPAGLTECVVRDDEICSEDLAEDRETYDYVVSVHGDKPWRIMRENEITELLTYGYPPHDPSYRSFKAYLQKNFRLNSREIETITKQIHLLSAYCHKLQDFFNVLDSFHIKLTRRQAEEISKLFQTVINNTPTFYNRGFAPIQMVDGE